MLLLTKYSFSSNKSIIGSGWFSTFAELTTLIGRQLRAAVRATLISNGGGEFTEETHSVIAGLTNTLSHYFYNFRRIQAATIQGMHLLRYNEEVARMRLTGCL